MHILNCTKRMWRISNCREKKFLWCIDAVQVVEIYRLECWMYQITVDFEIGAHSTENTCLECVSTMRSSFLLFGLIYSFPSLSSSLFDLCKYTIWIDFQWIGTNKKKMKNWPNTLGTQQFWFSRTRKYWNRTGANEFLWATAASNYVCRVERYEEIREKNHSNSTLLHQSKHQTCFCLDVCVIAENEQKKKSVPFDG